jgi:hypothetical protein
MMNKILCLLAFNIIGCVDEPSIRSIRGPNGESGWFHLSCGLYTDSCKKFADSVCPNGYIKHHLRHGTGTHIKCILPQ